MKIFSVKNILVGVVLSLSFLASGAHASCYVSGQIVERVIQYGTYGFIYFRPKSALSNASYYYVRTTNQNLLTTAAVAQANRTEVNALGDAASCPTTGTARYMGAELTYIYMMN